jgi:hypothetical protein
MAAFFNISLRIVFLLLALGGVGYFAYNFSENMPDAPNSESEQISELWQKDFSNLKKILANNKLIDKIKEIKLVGSDEETQKWVEAGIRAPIDTVPNGTIKLEVLVIQWSSDSKRGFILQQTFIDLVSGNTLFELGRTYNFNN